jgi:hypothetical protein
MKEKPTHFLRTGHNKKSPSKDFLEGGQSSWWELNPQFSRSPIEHQKPDRKKIIKRKTGIAWKVQGNARL